MTDTGFDRDGVYRQRKAARHRRDPYGDFRGSCVCGDPRCRKFRQSRDSAVPPDGASCCARCAGALGGHK